MADYTRNYDFQSGTVISSSQVDAEFNDIATAIATKPDADGSVQSSLNADQVDGYHAADNGGTGTIPVCSGTMQTNLNAQFVGGLAASDIGQSAFDTGTAMLFYQATAPTGWTLSSAPSIDRVVGISSDNANGGSQNATGTWVSSDFNLTINGHTLTSSEIPAVSVTNGDIGGVSEATIPGGGASKGLVAVTAARASSTLVTGISMPAGTTAGGGGSHTHTGLVETQSDYRPPIRWCVTATKDAP